MCRCWEKYQEQNNAERCKFKEGDQANKFGTDLMNLNKGKICTAKGFSATPSSVDTTPTPTLRFFLFPEFLLYLKSGLEAASHSFLSLVARRNPFELLASYSHVPYLKHDMYVCAVIMLVCILLV